MEQQPIPANLAAAYARCPQDERRSHPRLRCKGVAELRVFPYESKLPGTLLDLSPSGCCIETATPIPAVEHPCVEVHLRVNGFTLRIAGVVRNLHSDLRVGIEFVDVNSRKAEQIQELLVDLVEMESAAADSSPASDPPA